MADEIVYYKIRTGVQTKDPLREITNIDQTWLKTVLLGYMALQDLDSRCGFREWFNMENPSLPRQPMKNNQLNSPQTFCQGMLDKLNQSPTRRDLSPRQCQALEALSQQMSDLYDNQIPKIKFTEKVYKTINTSSVNFGSLFKQIKHTV